MGAVFGFIKNVNIEISSGNIGASNAREAKNFIEEIDFVLQILDWQETELPAEDALLVQEREKARREKDFEKADRIRETLLRKGISLEDTPYGTRWKTGSGQAGR